MSELYLIKKETLTAIADMIRENCPRLEEVKISPKNMPSAIADVWRDGYNTGILEGITETLNEIYAPMVIQGTNFPTIYGDYNVQIYYPIELFEEVVVGDSVFNWYDYIDYEVVASSTTCNITFTNSTNRYVYVFAKVRCILNQGESEIVEYVSQTLRREDVTDINIISTEQALYYEWIFEIIGLRFY